jgi:hypothetical protein
MGLFLWWTMKTRDDDSHKKEVVSSVIICSSAFPTIIGVSTNRTLLLSYQIRYSTMCQTHPYSIDFRD